MTNPIDGEIDLADTFELNEELEQAAATLAVGLSRRAGIEPLPESLAKRILDASSQAFALPAAAVAVSEISPSNHATPTGNRRLKLTAVTGWLTAAASIAALIWSTLPTTPTLTLPLEKQMEAMLQGRPPAPLKATEHPLAGASEGQLAWDGAHGTGFMKINGLPPVDPKRGVYQLWIFDKDRDQRYPVDGGTFTIPDGNKTAIIPFQAALPVAEPTLFAVTLEPPGGVVVSDRKRIMLTASLAR